MTFDVKRKVLVAAPWVLLVTTYLALRGLAAPWGAKKSYLVAKLPNHQ